MTTKRTPKSAPKPTKTAQRKTAKPKSELSAKSAPPASPTINRHGIVATADPRSVKRATELTDSIARRKSRIAEDFYEIGQALGELRDRELFRKVYGFDSFDEFLTKRAIYAPSQARKLMAIVAGVSKARALKLGVEKAYAALTLVAATPEKDTAEKVFADGRKVQGKRPSEASVEDFREEAREERAKARKAKRRTGVITDAKRERLAKRKIALTLLRKTLASIGVAKSSIHEREGEVAVLISWTALDKLSKR